MDIPWQDLKLFLAVAETGSFSHAAKRLRLGQPTVSRRLAELEYGLGYKLFERTARGASPTAAAARLLEPARRMAEWAGEAQRAAAAGDRAPQGLVRIAATPGIAFDVLAPFAAVLRKKLPKIRLEVRSKVEYVDLARGETDLALRVRAPKPGGDLVTLASIETQLTVYVARRVAAKLPKRRLTVGDVDWVAWAPPYDDMPPNPQLRALIPDFTPVFTTDDYLVLRQAAEAGVGAMILGSPHHHFARTSELVPLDILMGTAALHLVCAKSAFDVPRVRAVAELLIPELQLQTASAAKQARR